MASHGASKKERAGDHQDCDQQQVLRAIRSIRIAGRGQCLDRMNHLVITRMMPTWLRTRRNGGFRTGRRRRGGCWRRWENARVARNRVTTIAAIATVTAVATNGIATDRNAAVTAVAIATSGIRASCIAAIAGGVVTTSDIRAGNRGASGIAAVTGAAIAGSAN